MRHPRTLAATAAALTLALTGCSSSESDGGAGHNDQDVAYAGDMIQHHAQALQMVDLTLGRELDPAVADLADQIRAAQAPEIEKMADLLESWGERVPETSRDHAHADAGTQAEVDPDMPGMMSAEDLAELEKASGAAFEEMFLQMMVDHHQGAVEMAQDEVDEGESAKAIALAKKVVRTQQQEIETMQGLLQD